MIFIPSLYIICCITYACIGIYSLMTDPKNKLNKMFFIICTNLTLWSFMLTLMNSTLDVNIARQFDELTTFFWGTFYSAMLNFILLLTNKDKLLRKIWGIPLIYLPAAICIALYYFAPIIHVKYVHTPLGWANIKISNGFFYDNFFIIYFAVYMLICAYLLWDWGRKSNIRREKIQSKIILVTLLISMVLGSITDILFPIIGLTLTPPLAIFIVLIPTSAICYSIKHYRLMNLNPENVVLEVFKIMNEGLIIFNQNGKIEYVNKGALNLLGYEEFQLKGLAADTLIHEKEAIMNMTNCDSYEVDLITKQNKKIPVLMSTSQLTDNCGDSLGTVGIFQDINRIKHFQNELKNANDKLETRVKERTAELRAANIGLETEINTRINMEEKIKKMAYYDDLTGLPNKSFFNVCLQKAIESSNKKGLLAVLFLDLDFFKRINDTLGHAKGDELLKIVAKRLTSILNKTDLVARVGGDEFLILIQNLEDEFSLDVTSKRILETFDLPFKLGSYEFKITASVGGAVYPIDGEDVETIIKNADIAMYKAKESGKNKFRICTPVIKNNVAVELQLTNCLYRALENDEFELYYQPQICTKTGKIDGVEALLRWHQPSLGLLGPDIFIPIAEKTGLILPIGEWVVREACRQNKAWQDAGLHPIRMAVNLSVYQFSNPNFTDLIEDALLNTKLESQYLELEVTESIAMKETSSVVKILNALKMLGVTLSIDDFGTGYSSLKYLKHLPVDRVKIDMSFVRGISVSDKDEAIVSAIILLSKKLGLQVIAEGVETITQFDFLKQQSCNEIQGYYFYKPMIANEIEKLLTICQCE